jgi:hypothetical protein
MQPDAQPEGDAEHPLQIALYGKMWATVVGPPELSASGPGCVRTLAENLLQAGYAPERRLELWRGNERVGATTISAAAQQETKEST